MKRRTPKYAHDLKVGDEIVGNDGKTIVRVEHVLKLSASQQYPDGVVVITGHILPTTILHVDTEGA